METNQQPIEEIAPDFVDVDTGRRFPQARLIQPTTSGYLLMAAEVDRRPMLLPNSRPKRRLLGQVQDLVRTLRSDQRVLDATSEPRYRLVNHARWDRLTDVLPSLIFKPSFHRYVLAHFQTNGVAAMPVLYRLVLDPEELG
jgi:hypothetical protein